MEIRKLAPDDWKKLKEIRLDALKNDSVAFRDDFEEKTDQSDEEWKRILNGDKDHVYAAFDGGESCGMVAAYQEKGQKSSHVAYIWGVYVKKEYRGRGISKQLMQTLLDELQKNKEIVKVNLDVSATQLPAVKLYESLGFQFVGTLHKEKKVDGEFVDEHMMEKIF